MEERSKILREIHTKCSVSSIQSGIVQSGTSLAIGGLSASAPASGGRPVDVDHDDDDDDDVLLHHSPITGGSLWNFILLKYVATIGCLINFNFNLKQFFIFLDFLNILNLKIV